MHHEIRMSNMQIHDVIIVGAGMAGLGAARTLLESGIRNLVILEAQNYAGGRVFSHPLNESFVETGAQWIHGQNGNVVYELAKRYNLLADYTSAEGEGPYLNECGMAIDPNIIKEIHEVVEEILDSCSKFMDPETNIMNIPPSVGHYLKCNYEKYLETCTDDTAEVKKWKEELLDWHTRFQVIDNSCMDLDNLSAKFWGFYKTCEGLNYMNFKTGYGSLVQKLVGELPEGVLHLNCPVNEIDWQPIISLECCNGEAKCRNSNNSATKIFGNHHETNNNLSGTDKDSGSCHSLEYTCIGCKSSLQYPITVSCSNGIQYKAKHVIVTCSLGYLKENHRALFKQNLPLPMVKAIEEMGFATINKVFLDFEEPWWEPDIRGFQIVWSESNKDVPSREKPVSWLYDITGFDVLQNQKAVLLCWVGALGAELMEELSEQEVGHHCTDLLRRFTGKKDIPYPRKVIRSSWHNNTYIRGSYSNTTSICDKSGSSGTTLATPVCSDVICKDSSRRKHPVILLAGEAVHSYYFSTTHGAYESGQQQAKVILEYKQTNPARC